MRKTNLLVLVLLCMYNILASQSDISSGGLYFYCDPNTATPYSDFYIGFTATASAGTFDVIDVNGNISNNSGYVNDNTGGPTFDTVAMTGPIIFGGGVTEYYVEFGPFPNGTNVEVILRNTTNTSIVDTVYIGSYDCTGKMSGGCTDNVPFFEISFTSTTSSSALLLGRQRATTCCGSMEEQLEFLITLDSTVAGLGFELLGASGGGIDWTDASVPFDCNNLNTQTMMTPLCLGEGTFHVFAYKNGNNKNGVAITTVPAIDPPTINLLESCGLDQVVIEGADMISWSGIDNGITWDSLELNLDCGGGPGDVSCSDPGFVYNTTEFGQITDCNGILFQYQLTISNAGSGCAPAEPDTIDFFLFPDFSISLDFQCNNPNDPNEIEIVPMVNGAGAACDYYTFEWLDYATESPTLIIPDPDGSVDTLVTKVLLPALDTTCYDTLIYILPSTVFDIACPADVTIDCIDNLPPVDLNAVNVTNICDDQHVVFATDMISGGMGCIDDTMYVTRTYVADRDGDLNNTGDQISCQQIIKVVDNENPVFTPPAATFISCDEDVDDLALTGDVSGVSDNCGILDTMYSDSFVPDQDCPYTGLVTRTWTVRDSCMNATMMDQVITIVDNDPPTPPMPPADVTIACLADVPPTIDLTATDNCDNDITVAGVDSDNGGAGCPMDTLIITRTWTFTDACDNTATTSQLIKVVDDLPPSLPSPPADVTIACDTDIPANVMLTADDNCIGMITVSGVDTDNGGGGCPNDTLIITRTWTFTDVCNNIAFVSQLIKIVDDVDPIPPAAPAPERYQCLSEVPMAGILTATDNCSDDIMAMGVDSDNGGSGCIGDTLRITRTWTFTDDCGNGVSISQIIDVVDDTSPDAPTPPTAMMYVCPEDVPDPGSLSTTDNCSGMLTVTGIDTDNGGSGTEGDPLIITRTWTFMDICGNETSVSQTITVSDDQPTMEPMPPADAQYECIEDVPPPGDLTASESCGNTITVTGVDSDNGGAGCINDTLIITRTWTFVDSDMNTTSVSQTIKVVDDMAPVAPQPPADITVDCPAQIPATIDLTATDNCDAPITVSGMDVDNGGTGCMLDTLIITRTWTFADVCGNTSEISQLIKVVDDVAPVLPAQPIAENYQCIEEVPAPGDMTATDNCEGDIIVTGVDTDNGGTGCLSDPLEITRTWTFTDNCGNESILTQMIIVVDDTPPAAPSAPADESYICVEDVPPPGDLTATDNCSPDITVTGVDSDNGGAGTENDPLIITRTWTFIDECDNESEVSQTITVRDDLPTMDPTPPADAQYQCLDDVPPPGDLTASESCGMTITVTGVDSDNGGAGCINDTLVITRTWTFVDSDMNTTSVSQTIKVVDDEAPVAPSPPADVTIACLDLLPANMMLTATDNCDDDITVSGVDSDNGGSGCIGDTLIITRSWTFADVCSNTTTITQLIKVVDDIDPTPPAAPTAEQYQCIEEVPAPGDLTATDNCSPDITVTGVDSDNGGAGCPSDPLVITRTWTFADDCGNSVDISQMISVVDNTAPVTPIAPAPVTYTCIDDVPLPGDLTATDNCSPDITVTGVDSDNGGAGCPEDPLIITRTWTFVDECDNSSSISQIITVIDNIPPTASFPADLEIECEQDPNDLNLTGMPEMLDDNCTPVGDIQVTMNDEVMLEGCGGTGTITRTWTIIDACGNETSQDQIITVSDVNPPEFMIPGDIEITCFDDYLDLTLTGDIVTMEGGCDIGLMVSHTDNVNLDGCNGTGTVERTWTVADNCGNSDSQIQTITVIDETPPEVFCLDVTLGITGGDMVVLEIDSVDNGSFDCGDVVRSLSQTVFTCDDVGMTTVDLIVTDECDNVNTCTANITIMDLDPPTITGPADQFIELGPEMCFSVATFEEAIASDNCDIVNFERIDNLPDSGEEFYVGSNIITWEATDVSGNTARYSFEIFIQDFTPASFNCNGNVNISLGEECEYTVTAADLLEGGPYGCVDNYIVEVGEGTPQDYELIPTSPTVTRNELGKKLIYSIRDPLSGISCWGYILVEDKLAPMWDGNSYEVACDQDISPFVLGSPFDEDDIIEMLDVNTYLVDSLDNCVLSTVSYSDDINDMACASVYQTVVYRIWRAEDEFGYTNTVIDTINIIRPTLADFSAPVNFDGEEADMLICDEARDDSQIGSGVLGWNTLGNGYPAPDTVFRADGSVMWLGTGYPMGPMCENILISYNDIIVEKCDELRNCTKILREWHIQDWCAGESMDYTQVIKITDDEAPIFTNLPDTLIIPASAHGCEGEAVFGELITSDNCATEINTSIQSEGNISYTDNLGYVVSGLPIGQSMVYFYAEDCCGNIGVDSVLVITEDQTPPTAICKEYVTISLTYDGSLEFVDSLNGVAKIFPESIDNGSNDNCGEVWMKVRRKGAEELCGIEDEAGFNDFLKVCCMDAEKEYIEVYLRVYDIDPGDGIIEDSRHEIGGDLYGHYNECWTLLKVEDKLPPELVVPDDLTVTCSYYYNENDLGAYFGSININSRFREEIIGEDLLCPGDRDFDKDEPYQTSHQVIGLGGYVIDPCGVEINEEHTIVEGCGYADITRTFTAIDLYGNEISDVQYIRIESCVPFYINDDNCEDEDPTDGVIWPCDYETTGCSPDLDPSITGEPIINAHYCEVIVVDYEDHYFESRGPEGCFKIKRIWRVTNLCVDHEDQHWEYVQHLKVYNNFAPIISSCNEVTACAQYSCETVVNLSISAVDDCLASEDLNYYYRLDIGNNGIYDMDGETSSLSEVLAIGEHRILWKVSDGCGNVTLCEQKITVLDCKPPTAYCYSSLSTAVRSNNPSVIWASDFNLGSEDLCSDSIAYSFGPDIDSTSLTITCDDMDGQEIDTFPIELYVWDGDGNYDICYSKLVVTANDNCEEEDQRMVTIDGEVLTDIGQNIGNVRISVESKGDIMGEMMTDIKGQFAFPNLLAYQDYDLKISKEDDPLNGVSTLDIVILQRHILGIEDLPNMYKYLAGDVNANGKLSATDILEIRKLILGIYDDWPNNKPWRFVRESDYTQETIFKVSSGEDHMYNLVDNLNMKYVGIKTGDVNGTVDLNRHILDHRSDNAITYQMEVEDIFVKSDQRIILPIHIHGDDRIEGFQFHLSEKDQSLSFLNLASDDIQITQNNYSISDHSIILSWDSGNNSSQLKNDFYLLVEVIVHKDGYLSDMIHLENNQIRSEVYSLDLETIPLELRIGEKLVIQETLNVQPNPFVESTQLTITVNKAMRMDLELVNVNGKIVKVLHEDLISGVNVMRLRRDNLPSGLYLLRSRQNVDLQTRIIIVD